MSASFNRYIGIDRFSLDIKTRGLCHRFLNDVHLVRIPLNGAPLAQRRNRHLAGDG